MSRTARADWCCARHVFQNSERPAGDVMDMNTHRSLVLCATIAALSFCGCASAGRGTGALPTLAPASIASTQSVALAPTQDDQLASASRVAAMQVSLTVVTNAPTVTVTEAGTVHLACAVQITSFDPTYAHMVVAYAAPARGAGTAAFPTGTAPTPSALALAVPDFGAASTTLANTGFPGHPIWQGAVGQTQTHCVDITITVPHGQPSGTYSTTINFALMANVNHGLYATRVVQSSSLTATVTGAFTR
jgi:hypothetical protein